MDAMHDYFVFRPVYRITCSPFDQEAFLSCSADWTVKLWTAKRHEAVQTFHSVDLSEVRHSVRLFKNNN